MPARTAAQGRAEVKEGAEHVWACAGAVGGA